MLGVEREYRSYKKMLIWIGDTEILIKKQEDMRSDW
jgi:hypothetical protein